MERAISRETRGLSQFGLKYLAMVLMILDHIHYFFGFTGKIPLVFSWAGRLAAPLFLFCLIEGFVHTKNRRAYFLRIYVLAILMGLIQFSFYNVGSRLVRPDGFVPQNQMLASFVIVLVVLQGIDWCGQKKWGRGLAAVILPVILPFLVLPLLQRGGTAGFVVNLLHFSVMPLHVMIVDGGTMTLVLGIVLYAFRKKRGIQAAVFVVTVLLMDVVQVYLLVPGLTPADFFTQAYEWMGVFAVIPMLLYNGRRGHGSRALFYWFYPVHVYALYGLSWFLYVLM